MTSLRQSSFAGGYIGPQLLGRADQKKYQSGLRECRNAIVTRLGTCENRPGTVYIGSVKDQTTTKRLVKFSSTVGQGLLLEFGANYVRFFKNGSPITYQTVTGAWAGGTTYARSQTVTYNGTTYLSLAAANTGHQPDTSPTWWYAQPASGALELPTVIGQSALSVFQYVQINDIMYVAAQAFYPQVLTHYADNDWSIANFVNTAGIDPPTNVFITAGTTGSSTAMYVVTTVAKDGRESLPTGIATLSGLGQATNTHPWFVNWTANPDPNTASYNVYAVSNGITAFVGNSVSTQFGDIGFIASFAQQAPVLMTLFASSSDYPAVVGAFQQRLWFGNTVNSPQQLWASQVGFYNTFVTLLPITDSMAMTFSIAGRTRQFIHGIVDIGRLIILTSAGEFIAYGNQSGTVTSTSPNIVQHGYYGSALQIPLSIGSTALYVQARGNTIRDLQYSIYTTTYNGKEVTAYAADLFENRTITQMDWQPILNSIVWCVQDNGVLMGLTYDRSQEDWAWHRHDTLGGFVEQVCVVPEGVNDAVYLVVRRTINGSTARYIERLARREFADTVNLTDAIFTDCSLTYDGRNTGSTTITVTTGAGWTPQDALTLTASASTFASSDVGNSIILQQISTSTGLVTDSVRFDIIAYASGTVVTALPEKTVPTWARSATTSWGKAVHHFTGASVLEGQEISAQGDGAVVFNALTDGTPTTVTGGAFTTPDNYLVLTCGLPITAQGQTMPWEGGGRETQGNKQILIVEACPYLYNTRGGEFGQDFQHMLEWPQRGSQFEPMSTPPALFTGPVIINTQGCWQPTGQVCFQQRDPLPFAMSAIITTGEQGD